MRNRIRYLTPFAWVLLIAFSAGCAKKSSNSLPARMGLSGYEQCFDPLRGSNRALTQAERGDQDALTAFFLCGYVRLNQRIAPGDDVVTLRNNYAELLKCLGDDGFAEAIGRERPEIQSAAAEYFDLAAVKSYNLQTWHLLQETQAIDWPMKHAAH